MAGSRDRRTVSSGGRDRQPTRTTTHRPTRPAAGDGTTGSWLSGIRFSGFSLVMLGIMVLAVVVLAPTVSTLLAQDRQASTLQATVTRERADVTAMRSERARWNDPSYIRAQARDRLLYVMPGETSFLVIDDRPKAAKQTTKSTVSTSIRTTPTNWLGTLVGSAFTAGLAGSK